MSNVVAYVRVSSKAQTHDMQREAIARSAIARGDAIATWYAEKASARTLAREALQRLRDDARAGLVRRIYVFRVDRLTRTGIRDTLELVEEFQRHGVELVTIADGFSLDGPAAQVVLAVMAWAAQMERLATNERISAARDRVEASGGRWGRPRRLDGPTVARIRELRAEGLSVRAIAVALKIPRSTVGGAIAPSEKVGRVARPLPPSNLAGEPGVDE
jgi:DNA invertase Pin-like site-specific DNA recombinase